MHVRKELMLRSHAVIETTNIHFIVHKGATLLFRAPAMTIARDEVRIAYLSTVQQHCTNIYVHTGTVFRCHIVLMVFFA